MLFRSTRIRCTTVHLLALGAFSLSALAQEADPASSDEEVSEGIVTLSVFNVDASQDQGYRATNSISGTSLNTAIQDLPMPLEVITAEFVDDLAATDFKETWAADSLHFGCLHRSVHGESGV